MCNLKKMFWNNNLITISILSIFQNSVVSNLSFDIGTLNHTTFDENKIK